MSILRKMTLVIVLAMMCTTNIFANKSAILEQIRKDYATTNSEKNYKIKIENGTEPAQDSEVKYYTKNGILKKVVVNLYFESGKIETEYYVKNNKVYFIYEVVTGFDGIYYEHFWDRKLSVPVEVTKNRYYYDTNGKLIRYMEDDKIYEDTATLRERSEDHEKMINKIRNYR